MGQLNLKRTSTPETPTADYIGIFIDATGQAYLVDDTGATTLLAGATSLPGLLDFPASYTGQAGKFIRVKATEDGVEFEAVTPTVADDSITNVKLANMANSTIKGRVTAGTGDPEDLTASQVFSLVVEAEERASNTVLFDKNYIIGNAGARTGNILFDFTGAKLGAWTEMRHNDASAFTFPTEAMLMFDTADISTTVDNYFLFVLTDKTASSEVVKVFHAIEGGVV